MLYDDEEERRKYTHRAIFEYPEQNRKKKKINKKILPLLFYEMNC